VTLRSFLYLAREGFLSLVRYPALAVAAVMSICASFLVLAITLLVTANVERQATSIESRRVIDVYLAGDIGTSARLTLEHDLKSIDGVIAATFVSKEEALETFQQDVGGHDYIDALGYNPLPASFRLDLAEEARSGQRMQAIAEAAKKLSGVEEVRYGGDWIERLDAALLALRLIDLAAALLVGLSVAFAVGSTIRLTLLARREMIEIMKAVGATDSFICMPFLVEGVAHSLAAALVTLAGLRLVTALIASRVSGIEFLGPWQLLAFLGFAVVLGLAGAMGSLGIALRRST
jgi:cell division transport system permease protein